MMRMYTLARAMIVLSAAVGICAFCLPQTACAQETDVGNCLSYPVIWADGQMTNLRGTELVYSCEGSRVTTSDGVTWYLQQDELNLWQAESVVATDQVVVNGIDWRDSLEARDWTIYSIVRLETVLYKNLDTPMTGYSMRYLSGSGDTEMWGSNNTEVDPCYTATVYSANTLLTIQKLDDPDASLVWNAGTGSWVLAGSEPPVTAGERIVSASYPAEINIQGKVIFGESWNVRDNNKGAGTYRITFGFTGNSSPDFVAGETAIMSGEEVVTASAKSPGGPGGKPVGGGQAAIDFDNNLTYIDIVITERGGGGGAGNRPPR